GNLRRWIVAGPGQVLARARDRPSGYRLKTVKGVGSSVLTVPGFQVSSRTAAAFTFAPAKESIAERMGVTTEVGLISIHIFPEKMKGDIQPMPQSNFSTNSGGRRG